MSYDRDELAVILLDSMMGLEYKNKIAILDRLDSPKQLFSQDDYVTEVIYSVLPESKANTVASAFNENYLNHVVTKLESRNVRVITKYSENYPESLQNVDCPPLCLYCNGNVSLLEEQKIFAVVGTRKCPSDVLRLTKDFASQLSEAGLCLVTGSAGGVDSAVIEGALPSEKIISVVAGGINNVYPAYNKQLIERVEKFGLVISEQPPDFEVKPWLFPVRNRIIAGLAEGVLVAAGKRDSGARHTATFALEGGKDVFAFPYSIDVSYGELPNSLIKSGAHLCDDVNDILETMRVDVKKVASVKLEGDEKTVFSLIKDGVILADDLVERSGLKSYEVATVLTKLELGGFIARAAGNTYKAIK